MSYHSLVKKIIDLQEKIVPVVEAAEADGLQDADTREKMAAAQEWAKGADEKLSSATAPGMAPSMEPVQAFADHLYLYGKALDPHTQSLIAQYREDVEELFHMLEAPDVKPA